MNVRSEDVRENEELDEDWQPKADRARSFGSRPVRSSPKRSSGVDFFGGLFDLVEDLFEALFPLWMYLLGAAGVAGLIAVLYYLCEVLPKR